MLITVWSMKGGAGCSVVAACLALHLARAAPPALLVDLRDDLSTVLGTPPTVSPTLADLLRLGVTLDAAAIDAVTAPVVEGLTLLQAGPLGDRAERAAAQMSAADLRCVVDAGCLAGGDVAARRLARDAERSLLVTRACYLALRQSQLLPTPPTGVVLVAEPGRALGAADVERAIGVPIVVSVACDPVVARAVDAGLLVGRVPRAMLGCFEGLA